MDFSRGKRGQLEWEAEIGRRFKLINDMLDQRNARQAGLRFLREAGECILETIRQRRFEPWSGYDGPCRCYPVGS